MQVDYFQNLYDYHFKLNRKIWDDCILPLTDEQFTQKIEYSVGSIRNQVVHLMNIDDRWFAGLRGEEIPDFINPVHYDQRVKIRETWDVIETKMRAYLNSLTDDMIQSVMPESPFQVWQVLFHVLNHGTDHRAQMLAMLNQMGMNTFPQDYALVLMGKI